MRGRKLPGVCSSVVDAIGRTPLVALERLSEGFPGLVLAKLESFSPGGSVKDRIALRIIEDAEDDGRLKPGGAIVELTSGNTGIGLAVVAAVRGYRFHAVMSRGNSVERQRMLRALGADVVLVPQAPGGVPGEVSGEDLELVAHRATELTEELHAFRPDQFTNRSGFDAHEDTTGPEIWEQTAGAVDAFVASIGTAGTFVGVARALKKRNPAIRCIAAEPARTRTLAGCEVISTHHKIQGTGYNMVPPGWAPELCDEYLGVADEDAVQMTRLLATREGIFAGCSSGANIWAALQVARTAREASIVVTICPDTGLKYLSTDLFP